MTRINNNFSKLKIIMNIVCFTDPVKVKEGTWKEIFAKAIISLNLCVIQEHEFEISPLSFTIRRILYKWPYIHIFHIFHRENGPAIENKNGDKHWYMYGKRHRENGPSTEYKNGDKYWYKYGQRHREDGPAVELANGDKFWYKNGQYHREDGPAIEYGNGIKVWYMGGEFIHRLLV